ncbi:hypothetical protein ACFSHT_09715 [Paraburkholderia silviterrae]|uniref:Uncharacterized protein n=1 Tax=Paraburkholderia silviterrae TaxID=2528715 RepID=A0A4R5MDS2_9BURK|nr:hypothetical protein [Paraburkholderia silviterrae]TDG25248.1 hypothetical protein EYW47_05215 [Paraburkholderia silviterrae]
MKSMTLFNRGFMVSLSALALLALLTLSAPLASWLTPDAAAQPPRSGTPQLSAAHTGKHPWGLVDDRRAKGAAQAVPRGDLRSDIADNARRSAAPRQERPDAPRSR